MLKTPIFRGLETSDVQKIAKCLCIKKEKFNTNEIILSYGKGSSKTGIMVSGTADLVSDSYDGSHRILERYSENILFGELFEPFTGTESPMVVASSPCEVLLFEPSKLFTPCDDPCAFHDLFLQNIMQLFTEKIQIQSERIEVLSKRSLRNKLMTYFGMQAKKTGSPRFTLPFSLYALADYISVDRCAMQREMKKMREEGFIASHGKQIEILRSFS